MLVKVFIILAIIVLPILLVFFEIRGKVYLEKDSILTKRLLILWGARILTITLAALGILLLDKIL